MGIVRKLLLVVGALTLLFLGWLWWNQPVRVDMAAYVPADTLIYIEANNLPGIASSLTSTDAWKELAPPAGITSNFGELGWLSRLVAWTGIGSSDTVVLARAQVAVALLGFDAAVVEPDASAKISPRIALIAETHTGEGRVRAAVEKLVGEIAQRKFGAVHVERKEIDGVPYVSWVAQNDARRKLVAAVEESVAVVAKDESSVQICLAARRGERPTLAGDARLQEMRERLGANDALVFGYAPAGSAAKILEVLAPLFVGQISTNPNTQSLLAVFLPQLTNGIIGNAAWSSRVVQGAVEDTYYLDLPNDLAQRLSDSLTPAPENKLAASELLPADTYQLSRYNYRDPENAWRGLNAAISSQVDVQKAILMSRALESLLRPYGIESPQEYLRASGSEIVTARLESANEKKVLIVEVRDRESLNKQVLKRLGAGARREKVGEEEMIVSSDDEEGAASFVGDFLITGDPADVRRCLSSRATNRTLAATAPNNALKTDTQSGPPQVTTETNDVESARTFILFFARQRKAETNTFNVEAFESALRRRPYSNSETRLTDTGFQKKTRSSFGQFSWIVEQFAPTASSEKEQK